MTEIFLFLRRHIWVALMLSFIVSFYSLLAIADRMERAEHGEKAGHKSHASGSEKVAILKDLKTKEARMQEKLAERPLLSASLSLWLLFLICGGVYTDIRLAHQRWRGKEWFRRPIASVEPRWDLRSVIQAFVFLYFVEVLLYLLHIIFDVLGWLQMPSDYYLLAHSFIRNFAVGLFVLLLVRIRFGQGPAELGLVTESFGKRVREGLRSYLGVIPALLCLFLMISWVMKLFRYEPEPQNVVQIFLKPSSESYMIALTIFVAFVGPILEEVFFRGFAFAALKKKWGVWPGALVSSAVFAAFHLNAVAFFPILFLGLFLTYLYQATGSLIVPITAHMAHNILMVTFTLLFKSLTS